jgi:copper chaperone NosL
MERRTFLALLLKGLVAGWSMAQPQPLQVSVDRCPYCNMTVIDGRFAAQLITPLGRHYHYDAIECLVDHLNGHGPPVPEAGELYAADFARSTARDAHYLLVAALLFLHHPRIRTPMGGGLVAFSEKAAAERFSAERRLRDVRTLNWDALLSEGAARPWVPS